MDSRQKSARATAGVLAIRNAWYVATVVMRSAGGSVPGLDDQGTAIKSLGEA